MGMKWWFPIGCLLIGLAMMVCCEDGLCGPPFLKRGMTVGDVLREKMYLCN